MQRDMAAGMYAEVDLPEASTPEFAPISQKMDTIMGLSPSGSHDPQYVLLEQHCYLDLPGKFEDDDGLSLPYIVTVEEQSRQVLSIRRNYNKDDRRREKKIFAEKRKSSLLIIVLFPVLVSMV
jgi:hypothetical protein